MSNTVSGNTNLINNFGGITDQSPSFYGANLQNNIAPGSNGFRVITSGSGQYGLGAAGVQNTGAGQNYGGFAPAALPVGQNGFTDSSAFSGGSYSGGLPGQNNLLNSNAMSQVPVTGFTDAPAALPLATLPLTGFTAAPGTPSTNFYTANFNQVQGSNQQASGFASSLPTAINSGVQNTGSLGPSSIGSSNGVFQGGSNLQPQNVLSGGNQAIQTQQPFYSSSFGKAQTPSAQQQSTFPVGQQLLPQNFNTNTQRLESSGFGSGSSVGSSNGQSVYGSSPMPNNNFNSPAVSQGSAVQSYGLSFPQGAYGGPGTAQLNTMVGFQQPSYANNNNGYGQLSSNRPSSVAAGNGNGNGNLPFNAGSMNSGYSGFSNQAGGFGIQNNNMPNFGGGSGYGNTGVGGFNTDSPISAGNLQQQQQQFQPSGSGTLGQGLQSTSQSTLFNSPSQQQGLSNLQNQNMITTTPFSGFGGLASLAASIQQQLSGPSISSAIGATPSPAISPTQLQQQTGQLQLLPQSQVNNQQVALPINTNQNAPVGTNGFNGNQLSQQNQVPQGNGDLAALAGTNYG